MIEVEVAELVTQIMFGVSLGDEIKGPSQLGHQG